MGDKICIDTELLRQISSQLSQVHHSLSGVQQRLSSSVSEVSRVVSDQVGLINVLSSVQKNTQKASEFTDRLAKAVKNAADRWEEVERQIANQQLQGSEAAPMGTGGGAGTGAATWMDAHKATWQGAVIGTVLGGPFGMGIIGAEIGALIDAGYGPAFKDAWRFLTGKTDFEYSDSKDEGKNGNYSTKESEGNHSFRITGPWGMNAKYNIKEDKTEVTQRVSIGIAGGYSYSQSERNYHNGITEGSAKYTVGSVSGSGDVGLTLYDKNGKLAPKIGVNASAEGYLAKGEVSGKIGSEDLNIYGGAQGKVLGAGANGSFGITTSDDGKIEVGANVEYEAYLAKAEANFGFDIFGVKVGATGEAMIGITGSAGAKVGPNSAVGKFGVGPLKGKIKVDWSEFTKKYL